MTKKQEDFLNRTLAKLLTGFGISTDYEQRAARKRMDVVADVDGLRIVLEAETGFHRKAAAIKDADARLRQKLTTVAFAVCYPDGATEENLADATLTWTLRLRQGAPSGEWSTGSVNQLAQALSQAPRSLSGADLAAQLLSDGLDALVQRMKFPARQALAKVLDLPPAKRQGKDYSDGYFVAAKRGMLVVATAMLFHHRLQNHLPLERPTSYDGPWPPANPSVCAEQESPMSAYHEAWRGILAVDYRPVFETGRAALTALSVDPDMGQAVSSLARTVGRVSERVVGLRHDLLGRIFHQVLDTARYDGSYYTSTAAAVLLASLALREQDAKWGDANVISDLRICDPACGTGTLLMAAGERIRELRNAAVRGAPEDEELLDLALVEDVLWGYDSNLTATHMAAATVGMLSPATQFSRINIHRVRLGVFDGSPYVGSLEFLTGQARLAGWPNVAERTEGDEAAPLPPSMDLVIMNPPFTRDSLRYDQFSIAEEMAVKGRETELIRGHPYRAAARQHSSGGAFIVLAEKMLKQDKGTLALVLPSVVPTAAGNLALRQLLGRQFHVETIVSSHDPNRIYLSENTSIGEVLIICRRWRGDGPKPPTRVFNLARNPATPLEALDTATRIGRALMGQSLTSRDFTVQEVGSQRIARGDWLAINFLSPFLVGAYRTLSETNPGTVPIVPLSTLADVGPEGRRIRDAYTYATMPTPSGRRALWHHKTEVTQSMRAETDVYIEPKYSRRLMAENYWQQRSRLLLPHRLRLNLARVAAVILPDQAVGSIWTPCRTNDPDIAKALCLYLNSTPGLLSMLGARDNRILSYPSFSLDTLRSLPVPNFTALGAAERDLLSSWFDWLQHEPLQPFPLMADDPVRRQIDDAIIQALGFEPEWVATVRRELAREPSVTDTRVG